MHTFDFVSDMLTQGVQAGVFPSAVAAVGHRDQTLFTAAAGAADLNTRYDLASLSKILGPTMLALRAIEEGDLTLDDPLRMFFADAPEDKAGITVRQLMTHTGGFTPTFWLSEEAKSPEDAAACILRRPLEAPPDGTPRYSCMGYILLSKLLEAVYALPLDALANARVFYPLGMRSTGYNPSGANIAPTEVDPETGLPFQGVVHDENARYLGGVSGNAGIFSDVHDLIRFASMLACGGQGYLSSATLEKAVTNHTPGHDTRRGLGFHLGGTPLSFMGDLFPKESFGHTGFTGTSLVIDPQTGLFALLLTNRVHPTRANEKLFRFRRLFHNRVYASFTRRYPGAKSGL